MVMGIDFRRATLFATLALATASAPAAALAQDGRYVPAYEPSYTPGAYTQLGAYSLAGAFSVAVVDTGDTGRAEVKPAQSADAQAEETALAQADQVPVRPNLQPAMIKADMAATPVAFIQAVARR